MKKHFAYYCSDGASRIIKFYSNPQNKIFNPEIIIYDGKHEDIIQKLKKLFGSKLVLIDDSKLSQQQKKRIHNYTSEHIHKLLVKHNVEYLICFGNKILKKKLIDDYKNKLINFHPSLLPAFKGLQAIDQALNYGVSFIGNTAHYINEGVDTGKIIIQSTMPTNTFESYEDVLELQLPMLKIIFRDILNYGITEEKIYDDIKERTKPFMVSPRQIKSN